MLSPQPSSLILSSMFHPNFAIDSFVFPILSIKHSFLIFLLLIIFSISCFLYDFFCKKARIFNIRAFCEIAATPILVRPGSSARITGCKTEWFSYNSCMVYGTYSTTLAFPVCSNLSICRFLFVGICGLPSMPNT